MIFLIAFFAGLLVILLRKPSSASASLKPASVAPEPEKPASISESRPLDYPDAADYAGFFDEDTNNEYDESEDTIGMRLFMDYLFNRLDKSISDTVERKLCEQHVFAKPFPEGVEPARDVACFVSVKTNSGTVNIEANPGNKVVIDAVTQEGSRRPASRRKGPEAGASPRVETEIPFGLDVDEDAASSAAGPASPSSSKDSGAESRMREETGVTEAGQTDLPFGDGASGEGDAEDGKTDAAEGSAVAAPVPVPPMPPIPAVPGTEGDGSSSGVEDVKETVKEEDEYFGTEDERKEESGEETGGDSKAEKEDEEERPKVHQDELFLVLLPDGQGQENSGTDDGSSGETDGSVGGPAETVVKAEEVNSEGKRDDSDIPDEVRYILEHPQGMEVLCDYVSGRLGLGIKIQIPDKEGDEVFRATDQIHSILKGKSREELCKILQVYFHSLGNGAVSVPGSGESQNRAAGEDISDRTVKHVNF